MDRNSTELKLALEEQDQIRDNATKWQDNFKTMDDKSHSLVHEFEELNSALNQ